MTDRSNYFASSAKWMSKAMYKPGEGETLTIKDVRDHTFKGKDGGADQHKLCLEWKEDRPPLGLNKTNYNWLLGTFGPDDDNWVRKRVKVWHDPSIEYPKGTRIGGLVLDTPDLSEMDKTKAALKAQIAGAKGLEVKPQPQKDPDDDIPF